MTFLRMIRVVLIILLVGIALTSCLRETKRIKYPVEQRENRGSSQTIAQGH
jgi:hypothetical protein